MGWARRGAGWGDSLMKLGVIFLEDQGKKNAKRLRKEGCKA
jgi:hypothetical protein